MSTVIEELFEQARAHRRDDNFAAARESANAALELARKGNENFLLARALMMQGQIERDKGKLEAAAAPYEEAISILRKSGDDISLANAVRHLGDLETERKCFQSADAAYTEALGLYRSLANVAPLTLANALRAYAVLKDQTNELDAALQFWREAKMLYEKANVQAGVDECAERISN